MHHNDPDSKRTVATLITLALLVSSLVTACGGSPTEQTKPSTVTIGILKGSTGLEELIVGFKAGMSELGYVEGKTIVYEDKGAFPDSAALEAEGKRLTASKVNMVLALGTNAALAAKKTVELPVVFAPGGDPVALGIVQSLANPTGNLTGVGPGIEYPARTLEYLTKMAPSAKRVLLIYAADGVAVPFLPAVKKAAPKLGLELVLQTVRSSDDLTAFLQNFPAGVDAVFILPDALVSTHVADILKVTNQRKLPLLAVVKAFVQGGAVLAYGWDYAPMGKQAARLADRLLKGAKPSSMPIEAPEFYLFVNLKAAEAIGLTIPNDILRQAATIVR